MGDVSAEPSMEDILSSIKRIIAEEGEAPGSRTRRPFGRGASTRLPDIDDADEILELDQPMSDFLDPEPVVSPSPRITKPTEELIDRPVAPAPTQAAAAAPNPAPIVSPRAAEASRGALDNLSRLLIKPENPASDTLEGLVREMLRPMLKEWLDAQLPELVERLVAQEIARITGQHG